MASTFLGPHCAVAARSIDPGAAVGFASQLPIELSRAGARRRATYVAGRACAHAALKALGVQEAGVPIGTAGAPVWPSGFVGSISHTDRLAAAVVAPDPPVRGVGLDIEDDRPLEDYAMVRLVCRPDEMPSEYRSNDPEGLLLGKLFFVVKEAVYKLHQPLGGAFLDFLDVRVTLTMSDGRFRAELVHPEQLGAAGSVIRGGFARGCGLLAALAVSCD